MRSIDPFERAVASLRDAALDDSLWAEAARLIDDVCGATGSSVFVGQGVGNDARVSFAAVYRHGVHRPDLERDYYHNYFHGDERIPRLARLRAGKLVPVADLYTARELKTSATWNEALLRGGSQNGLNVRLRGLHGLRVTWIVADPAAGQWETDHIRTIRRLMPHMRSFVHLRQALAGARALGGSLVELLDRRSVGVIHLDRRGRIVVANDRARGLLRQGSGIREENGLLRAWLPEDDARLSGLVAAALPAREAERTGGSMLLRHPKVWPGLTLHVHPMSIRQMDFGAPGLGALVLIDGMDQPARIDAGVVGSVLGLTPAESRVAVLVAEGRTVPDIAIECGRAESSIRTHMKKVHRKLGVSRRAELVRRVLAAHGQAGFRHGG